MTEQTIPRTDYRNMAVEHGNDELLGVAGQSAAFREMTKITLAMVAERDKRIASLQRQLRAVNHEYQAHRERTMRASIHVGDSSEPVLSHTYTTKHQAPKGTQYIPLATTTRDPRCGADA